MRLLLWPLLVAAFCTQANAQFAGKRQLLVFGAEKSREVKKQLLLFRQAADGLRERDLQIVMADTLKAGRQKHRVAAEESFMLILVGKDGGEKFRSRTVTLPQTLFDIIDAMPMRRAEMRRTGNKGQSSAVGPFNLTDSTAPVFLLLQRLYLLPALSYFSYILPFSAFNRLKFNIATGCKHLCYLFQQMKHCSFF